MPSFAKNSISKEEFISEREENIALYRGIQDGKPFDPQLRVNGIRQLEAQQEKLTKTPESVAKDALQAVWTELVSNPIPNAQVQTGLSTAASGRTAAIAVHPTDPNTAYVGTAQGGVFRTADEGNS